MKKNKILGIVMIAIALGLAVVLIVQLINDDLSLLPGSESSQTEISGDDEKKEVNKEDLIERKSYKGLFTVKDRSSPISYKEIWHFQDGYIYFYREETKEDWSAPYRYDAGKDVIRIRYAADNIQEYPFVIGDGGKYVEIDGSRFKQTKLKDVYN